MSARSCASQERGVAVVCPTPTFPPLFGPRAVRGIISWSTVTTAHGGGDGADRTGHRAGRTVSPFPNSAVAKQAWEGREEAYRRRKFFVAVPPYSNGFRSAPPFLVRRYRW